MLPSARYKAPKEQPPIPIIQGKQVDSLNEFYVGLALERLGVPYLYRVSYWGGRSLPGGVELDFLAWPGMGALQTGIQVYGRYWHSGQKTAKDRIKEIIISQFLGKDVVILWDDETDTLEKSISALRRRVV